MKRERIGQLLFLASTAFALALYGLTACSGFPWGESTHEALGWSGVLSLPALPHPVWGYFVRVFAGHYIALACVSAALAAGLLASVLNRHFGWRVAIGASVIWVFCPPVWNAAVTGDRLAFRLAALLLAFWLANAAVLWAWGKARRLLAASSAATTLHPAFGAAEKFGRWNLLAARVFMGAAAVFALGSLTFHDYRLGEAATVYARGIVEEAAGRCIVLNGAVDDQVEVEVTAGETVRLFDMTDFYRSQLVARVSAKWPDRADFKAAAQVSPAAFVEAVGKDLPDAFYFMDGRSTSLDGWEKRWAAFQPYLKSRDAVVPLVRRAFACEGNALANRLQDVGGADAMKQAWQFYWRLFDEIDPGNFSALVNMSEMVRRGHSASASDRERIKRALDDFFSDKRRQNNARLIARLSGPVRADRELLAKLQAEAKKRRDESKASGKPLPLSKDVQALIDANNEMVRAMDGGDFGRAGGLARRILSQPSWRSFVPANAVLGAITASEGDYASSERFFRTALAGEGEIAAVTYNDFADTLLNLGKLEEAETYARKAVERGGDKLWLAKLTLAEALIAQKKNPEEVRELLRAVSKACPVPVREKVKDLKRKAGAK